jgi:multiple sugar transport system substrate-binding protein
MERGGYKLVSNGPQADICRYRGETYGVLTDGNVHTCFVRKDLMEEHGKRFEDKFGKKIDFPETWDDYLQLGKFFYEATDGKIVGFADLRSRKAGAPDWFMMAFYSHGGFPFADDMSPTLNNAAGQKAMELWVGTKAYQAKEASTWGTPQTIPFFNQGNAAMMCYWDGSMGTVSAANSPTRGKWRFGVVPGSRLTGRLVKRSISQPCVALVVNARGQNPEAAYWLCQYLGGTENSTKIVADPENVFHDAWHPKHMTDPRVFEKYTPEGVKVIEKSLQIVTPAILVPGFPEFWDLLDKNLADAFVGTIKGDEALKKTEEEWKDVIKRVGAKRLSQDLKTYRAAFPKVDVPT